MSFNSTRYEIRSRIAHATQKSRILYLGADIDKNNNRFEDPFHKNICHQYVQDYHKLNLGQAIEILNLQKMRKVTSPSQNTSKSTVAIYYRAESRSDLARLQRDIMYVTMNFFNLVACF